MGWIQTIECVAALDCILSLACYSKHLEGIRVSDFQEPKCLPRFDSSCMLKIEQMRYPLAIRSDNQFIANDLALVRPDARTGSIAFLSGPNMGGKSTVLRQAGLIAILAQIGCLVPAKSCLLSPFDRIFTRIGSSDSILEGKSTFMTELDEAKTLLNEATPQSLVIIDELGRGTSTIDGYPSGLFLEWPLRALHCITWLPLTGVSDYLQPIFTRLPTTFWTS